MRATRRETLTKEKCPALQIICTSRKTGAAQPADTGQVTWYQAIKKHRKIPPLNFWNWLNTAFFSRRGSEACRERGTGQDGARYYVTFTAVRFEIRSQPVVYARRAGTVLPRDRSEIGFWTYAAKCFSFVCFFLFVLCVLPQTTRLDGTARTPVVRRKFFRYAEWSIKSFRAFCMIEEATTFRLFSLKSTDLMTLTCAQGFLIFIVFACIIKKCGRFFFSPLPCINVSFWLDSFDVVLVH